MFGRGVDTRIKSLTLSIAGPEAREMPLSIWGPLPVSGSISLFTQGPEANSLTLSIGKDVTSSGTMPLYLEVPWAVGSPGSTLVQEHMSLSVLSPTSGTPISTEASLYISAPLIGSGIGAATLHITQDAITPEQYERPPTTPWNEGYLTTAVSGLGAHNSQTTLFIRVEETATSTTPLYIERNLAASMPLTITSQIVSGVIPVAISGAYFDTSSTSLYIQAPTGSGLTTHIRGYLE
jgi:hypothetical protein